MSSDVRLVHDLRAMGLQLTQAILWRRVVFDLGCRRLYLPKGLRGLALAGPLLPLHCIRRSYSLLHLSSSIMIAEATGSV